MENKIAAAMANDGPINEKKVIQLKMMSRVQAGLGKSFGTKRNIKNTSGTSIASGDYMI